VLWGDPAMTTSGTSYSVVFMSNLAIPNTKFPVGALMDQWLREVVRPPILGAHVL